MPSHLKSRPNRATFSWRKSAWASLLLLTLTDTVHAVHHMKRKVPAWVNKRDDQKPLHVTNNCPETIWPGVGTQNGDPPESQGFKLNTGETRKMEVSADWQGRVWGRTNCTFDGAGRGVACETGDCGGTMECRGTGVLPVSLAEFTLASTSGQAFYDISLVDGYNIPLGIISLYPQSGNSSLTEIPPNLTNPMCIGTASLLGAQGSMEDAFLGSNGTFPLPLDQSQTHEQVQRWCPWDLQLSPPKKPGDGVYPYPDDNIQRPFFNPCYSACAKYNKPEDCCTGKYNQPDKCKPGLYSKGAKGVCPDAYSFAFDDQTSTFIIPSGGGFEVIFCPAGRSTTILSTMSQQLHELSQTGHVSQQLLAEAMNLTLIRQKSQAGRVAHIDGVLLSTAVLSLLSAMAMNFG